jgi:hypothetical protein
MVRLYVNPNAGKGPGAVPKACGFDSSGQADTIFWYSLNKNGRSTRKLLAMGWTPRGKR